MRKTLLVTTLLALFSAVPAAQAASTASATLDMSKFNVSVLEGKGSFAFDNGRYASAEIYDNGWTRDANYINGTDSANVRVSGLTGSATANAQTVSAVADAQYASDPYGYGSGNVSGTTYAFAQVGGTATLDPFSDMVIRVPYALTITTPNQAGEWANAGAWLTATRNGDGSQSLTSQANWSSGWTYSTFSDIGKLGLLLSNTTATQQTFSVYAYASANTGTVAAVPEPETYSMMMAGLGLLGFVARKRNQPAA